MQRTRSKKNSGSARFFFALLAGIVLISPALGQTPAERKVDSRCLLIFDTAAEMKKRVPQAQKALENLFVTGLSGQLESGDTIGVWTFDQDLRTGQFPLQYWVPEQAATITGDINTFVGKQRYSKATRYAALQPLLNEVAQGSERLTVLIFCDGETPMTGTPYDAGITEIFREQQAGQKKLRQPFIIILRAQFGQYTGCTVDFPPVPASFPEFPPLPPPPAPPAPPTPPPPKRRMAPSIIMIGTNPPPAPKLEITNAPALTNSLVASNVIYPRQKISIAPTNAAAMARENFRDGDDGALAMGAGLLAAAGALGIFMLHRSRRNNHASLITRSMRKK